MCGDSTSTGNFVSKQTSLKYIPTGSERLFLSASASCACLALTSTALQVPKRLKSPLATSGVTGWFDLGVKYTVYLSSFGSVFKRKYKNHIDAEIIN